MPIVLRTLGTVASERPRRVKGLTGPKKTAPERQPVQIKRDQTSLCCMDLDCKNMSCQMAQSLYRVMNMYIYKPDWRKFRNTATKWKLSMRVSRSLRMQGTRFTRITKLHNLQGFECEWAQYGCFLHPFLVLSSDSTLRRQNKATLVENSFSIDLY